MKNNILIYAYRGLFSTLYFLFGKRKKIREMFIIDDENAISLDSNDVFAKNRKSSFETSNEQVRNAELMDKLHFKYQAKDMNGKIIKGSLDAYNVDLARKYLNGQGLEVLKIELRKKYDIDINIGNPINTSELCFALAQLATYLRAGITLVDSVRILAKQTEKPAKRKVYDGIVYDLLEGDNFSTALTKQGKIFPKLLINMCKSAELTGDLANVLEEMADYYTSIDTTKKQIKSAMTYPIVVLIFAILVVTFVLVWVVPQYESMFAGMDAALPTITVWVINVSDFLQEHVFSIFILLIIILLIYRYLFNNVRSFRLLMQTLYMHIPVIKNSVMYSEVSMFARTFSSLLSHGVYITDSMDVLLNVSENEVYRKIILKTVQNLNAGGKISDAFKGHWAFPLVAYEMIVTGETTGQLAVMMEKVANYYDNLHRNAVNAIKSLIEPILIVFLAGSVGIIILSIILPMFEMYKVIS